MLLFDIYLQHMYMCMCQILYFLWEPLPHNNLQKILREREKRKIYYVEFTCMKVVLIYFYSKFEIKFSKMHHWIANLQVNLILDFLKLLKTCLIHIQTAQC